VFCPPTFSEVDIGERTEGRDPLYFILQTYAHGSHSPTRGLGSLQRSPDSPAGFKGPTSKGRGRERREGRNPLYFFCRSAPMIVRAST